MLAIRHSGPQNNERLSIDTNTKTFFTIPLESVILFSAMYGPFG